MKRKFIVIIFFQTFLIGIAFIYAFIQQTKAIAAQSAAEDNLELAIENEKTAINAIMEQERLKLKLDSLRKTIASSRKE